MVFSFALLFLICAAICFLIAGVPKPQPNSSVSRYGWTDFGFMFWTLAWIAGGYIHFVSVH